MKKFFTKKVLWCFIALCSLSFLGYGTDSYGENFFDKFESDRNDVRSDQNVFTRNLASYETDISLFIKYWKPDYLANIEKVKNDITFFKKENFSPDISEQWFDKNKYYEFARGENYREIWEKEQRQWESNLPVWEKDLDFFEEKITLLEKERPAILAALEKDYPSDKFEYSDPFISSIEFLSWNDNDRFFTNQDIANSTEYEFQISFLKKLNSNYVFLAGSGLYTKGYYHPHPYFKELPIQTVDVTELEGKYRCFVVNKDEVIKFVSEKIVESNLQIKDLLQQALYQSDKDKAFKLVKQAYDISNTWVSDYLKRIDYDKYKVGDIKYSSSDLRLLKLQYEAKSLNLKSLSAKQLKIINGSKVSDLNYKIKDSIIEVSKDKKNIFVCINLEDEENSEIIQYVKYSMNGHDNYYFNPEINDKRKYDKIRFALRDILSPYIK